MLINATPIIWPLLDKLNLTLAMQQAPKIVQNKTRLVRLPAFPWDDGDRPPLIGYGKVEGSPKLWELAPWNFGLCALNIRPVDLKLFKTNPRALPISEQRREPAVVKPMIPAVRWNIDGVTRDLNGAILGSCAVDAFRTSTDTIQGTATSDANGNFRITLPTQAAHYLVAYKTGSPDVAGTTLNTLTGV